MIIAIWVFAWLFAAHSVGMALLPLVAILIRRSFLEESVRIDRRVLFVTAGVFVLFAVFSDHADLDGRVNNAAVVAVRTFCMIILVKHLLLAASSASANPLRQFPFYIAALTQVFRRGFRLVRDHLSEADHIRRIRARNLRGHASVSDQLHAYFLAKGAVIAELVGLRADLQDILTARGGFPHPRLWQEKAKVQRALYVADVLLFCLSTAAVILSSDHLYPHWVLDSGGWVRSVAMSVRQLVS